MGSATRPLGDELELAIGHVTLLYKLNIKTEKPPQQSSKVLRNKWQHVAPPHPLKIGTKPGRKCLQCKMRTKPIQIESQQPYPTVKPLHRRRHHLVMKEKTLSGSRSCLGFLPIFLGFGQRVNKVEEQVSIFVWMHSVVLAVLCARPHVRRNFDSPCFLQQTPTSCFETLQDPPMLWVRLSMNLFSWVLSLQVLMGYQSKDARKLQGDREA
jgi:hypothetical protein